MQVVQACKSEKQERRRRAVHDQTARSLQALDSNLTIQRKPGIEKSDYQRGYTDLLELPVAAKALHDNYLPVLWISRGALARGPSRMNRGLAPGG